MLNTSQNAKAIKNLTDSLNHINNLRRSLSSGSQNWLNAYNTAKSLSAQISALKA